MDKHYEKKRDFGITPEPAWSTGTGSSGVALTFVVQEHKARRRHFDFRLELDGVLKSWAVPRGISLDPTSKRLAVMVEDHPFEYGSFEGMIPEGQYGAGEVRIWDKGTYSPEQSGTRFFDKREQAEKIMREGFEKGEIKIYLNGNILKGSFALVRLKKGEKNWLIIKHEDDKENPKTKFEATAVNNIGQPVSATTGKGDIAKPLMNKLSQIPGARPAPFPANVSPMLAFTAKQPFSDPNWIFEPKLDGFRIIASVFNGKVKLVSRNGIDATRRFHTIAENEVLKNKGDMVVDGEVVALDQNGRPCFQCLQEQLKTSTEKIAARVIYFVFDIVYIDGYELRAVPLMQRKQILGQYFSNAGNVRKVDFFERDGELVYRTAVTQGFEGVVAKKRDSIYESGRRSPNWIKIKVVQSDDFIVGGYETGRGNRDKTIGALLLGNYEDKKLVYSGQVGSGLRQLDLSELKQKLDRLKTEASPFLPSPSIRKPIIWVKPELVVEVKYAQRSKGGLLRAPVFLRLREDKPASQVIKSSEAIPVNFENIRGNFDLIQSIVTGLKSSRDELAFDVEGHAFTFTNLTKIYWPATKFSQAVTKRDLLIYLTEVSPFILPHLKNRPVTLNRYPEGITGSHFFQRHWHTPLPDFVGTIELPEEETGESGPYILCNNLATLLWLGQSGNLEVHAWFSRISEGEDNKLKSTTKENIAYLPDFIIFDLDPYIYSGEEIAGAEPELNRSGFLKTVALANWLREILEKLSLPSFVKTSGKTGLHVFVPIHREYNYEAVRAASKTITAYLLKEHPKDLTTEWPVAKRAGKIFIDYRQNTYSRTLASIYSPRAAPGAPVSMGLYWDELNSVYPTDFNLLNTVSHLSSKGDPWKDILNNKADLRSVLKM